MGRFWERYLFGDDRDFCWIVKKIEKSSKFFGHFGFFLEDTYTRAEKGINNISHAGKEKMGKMEKNQTTFGFSSKILVWSDPMATLTTTLNEQKGKSMNNTS
jgi:hypothetical protein